MDVKIDGFDSVRRELQKLEQSLRDEAAKKATGRMAAIIRDEAKAKAYRAPASYMAGPRGARVKVQPGHVARNIIMKRTTGKNGELLSEHIVTVSQSQDGPYGAKNVGVFLEYGINMSQAHPFMRPAFDSKKAEAENAARTILSEEIKKAWTLK